jgi:spermidine synthase
MKLFVDMHKILPEGKQGIAEIKHIEVTKKDESWTRIRAAMHPEEYVEAGHYVQLLINGSVMMSDTQMEKRSNIGVICEARGHVLIAGLGMGMILPPILARKEVKSVTVIEKSRDVIDLVEPSLLKIKGGRKLKVIEADIFDWKPEKGTKFDVIYFDIWPNICTDNLLGMATLHQRFAKCKAPGGWMNSWKREHLLSERRRDREFEREIESFRNVKIRSQA